MKPMLPVLSREIPCVSSAEKQGRLNCQIQKSGIDTEMFLIAAEPGAPGDPVPVAAAYFYHSGDHPVS